MSDLIGSGEIAVASEVRSLRQIGGNMGRSVSSDVQGQRDFESLVGGLKSQGEEAQVTLKGVISCKVRELSE